MTPAVGASWTAGVPPACTGFGAGEHRGWRSRGYLPHLDAANLVQHIVFRLADSLPSGIRAEIAKIPADDRVHFDRFMRSDEHLAATLHYIEENPVKAGLCAKAVDWQFSSAWNGWGGRDARGPSRR